MKRRTLTLLWTLALILGLPTVSLAGGALEGPWIDIGDKKINTQEQTEFTAGEGWSYDPATKVLELNNYSGSNITISESDVVIKLVGENTIGNGTPGERDGFLTLNDLRNTKLVPRDDISIDELKNWLQVSDAFMDELLTNGFQGDMELEDGTVLTIVVEDGNIYEEVTKKVVITGEGTLAAGGLQIQGGDVEIKAGNLSFVRNRNTSAVTIGNGARLTVSGGRVRAVSNSTSDRRSDACGIFVGQGSLTVCDGVVIAQGTQAAVCAGGEYGVLNEEEHVPEGFGTYFSFDGMAMVGGETTLDSLSLSGQALERRLPQKDHDGFIYYDQVISLTADKLAIDGEAVSGIAKYAEIIGPNAPACRHSVDADGVCVQCGETVYYRGSLGHGKDISWTYFRDDGSISFTGDIPEGETVFVGCYDESGKFIGAKCVGRRSMQTRLDMGLSRFKLFWLNETQAPQCQAGEVKRNP